MLLFVYRVCQELLDFQLQKKRKGVGVIRALIKVKGQYNPEECRRFIRC